MSEDKIKDVVARKLRGLPPALDEPQVKRTDGQVSNICSQCGENPVAEKGSQAHAEGLCVDCATFKRRHGLWKTEELL